MCSGLHRPRAPSTGVNDRRVIGHGSATATPPIAHLTARRASSWTRPPRRTSTWSPAAGSDNGRRAVVTAKPRSTPSGCWTPRHRVRPPSTAPPGVGDGRRPGPRAADIVGTSLDRVAADGETLVLFLVVWDAAGNSSPWTASAAGENEIFSRLLAIDRIDRTDHRGPTLNRGATPQLAEAPTSVIDWDPASGASSYIVTPRRGVTGYQHRISTRRRELHLERHHGRRLGHGERRPGRDPRGVPGRQRQSANGSPWVQAVILDIDRIRPRPSPTAGSDGSLSLAQRRRAIDRHGIGIRRAAPSGLDLPSSARQHQRRHQLVGPRQRARSVTVTDDR